MLIVSLVKQVTLVVLSTFSNLLYRAGVFKVHNKLVTRPFVAGLAALLQQFLLRISRFPRFHDALSNMASATWQRSRVI